MGKWTEVEDDALRAAVKDFGGKSWKKIASRLPGRTDVQCLHRWQKVRLMNKSQPPVVRFDPLASELIFVSSNERVESILPHNIYLFLSALFVSTGSQTWSNQGTMDSRGG